MREFQVEIGDKAEDRHYTRLHAEPILARTNDEAMLIADEVIRKADAQHRAYRRYCGMSAPPWFGLGA